MPAFRRRQVVLVWLTLFGVVTFLTMPAVVAQDTDAEARLLWDRERAEELVRALQAGVPYVPGEVLVKFHSGVAPPQQARALSSVRGAVSQERQRWIGDVLLVHADDEPDAERMAAALERQPEVVYAEPNYISKPQAIPNDPFYRDQWNFDLIRMPAAWDINPGGSDDLTIAVIDSGITAVSRSFNWRLWTSRGFGVFTVPYAMNPDIDASRVLPGFDFVFFASGGPVLDMQGHGTHVAGTILQTTNNNSGLAGMSYRSRLMPLNACFSRWDLQILLASNGVEGFLPADFGGCPVAAEIAALRYAADNGARIVNISLGGTQASPAFLEALRYAVGRGVFVSVSAGNGFEDGNPTSYPAAYAAQVEGVMSVGAVGPSSRRAYYSQTGSWVEIVAPGGDVRSGGSAALVRQAGLDPRDSDPLTVEVPRFDRYVVLPAQGTSMAAPHVAGLAALLHSQGVTTPAAIEAAIKRFAVDLGAPGRDDEYGHGLIDARATLRGLGVAR